ncbi:glycosyl hydrolase 53 family protein [Actinospica sp. MGRD01-02]|uniref:Arabinogalactan endo-beta-1,4-galactanase n=1 Tax=Actinospica acidithermotolerans TaxID=2828514 RepID=A0A941IL01_9ACTN|nr:glycosyl hydrolase 53 family protein [Actinospica acidithermotolerans]MBR7829482.1 glycosyl hydrolase 53 family protein [Actinospica acidithermotolerans]
MNEISISRRHLLRAGGLGAGALALGGLGEVGGGQAEAATTFSKGADVSWVPQMEAKGYSWLNSGGVKEDILTILKGYGMSAVRLRTWVNPSSDPANGHCSISETAAMAVRVKDAGMDVNIDYHFGDTWNSVGVQNPPAAWASMTYFEMLSAMYTYVYHTMNVIKANGVTPRWVQIGNEINSGICHPIGSVSNPAQMTGLLNAAHDMVKEVFPSTNVMIHLAQPQNCSSMTTFFDAFAGHGGTWDWNGFSSYGSAAYAAGIVANMAEISNAYSKPFMQVEFGGAVTKATSTEDALQAYLKALVANGGQGLLYWEPEVMTPFDTYDMGAWDSATYEPTAALNGFSAV